MDQARQEARADLQNLVQRMTDAEVTVSNWRDDLADMQYRADRALMAAQQAWEDIVHRFAVASSPVQLLADAGFVPSNLDDLVARAGGLLSSPLAPVLMDIFPDEMAPIRTAQEIVDEIRDEYRHKSQLAVDQYDLVDPRELASLGGLAAAGSSPHQKFVRSAQKILEDMTGVDTKTMDTVAEKASKAAESPDAYRAYLDALEDLSPEELSVFFAAHSDLAFYPLTGTGDAVWDAATVKAWWAGLDEQQQQMLIQAAPGLIGNLNGVPYGVRDRANRVLVDKLLSERNPADLDEASLEAVRKVQKAGGMGTEAAPVSIVLLDISNSKDDDGIDENNVLAATAVGDVDAADVVSVAIPGMDNNVTASMDDMTKHATTMYNQQKVPLESVGKSSAVIAYIGYETPQLNRTGDIGKDFLRSQNLTQPDYPLPPMTSEEYSRSVLNRDMAVRGGQQIASFVDGINVTKSTNTEIPTHGVGTTDAYNDPFVSLQAHSYGTTTTAEALTRSQTAVDNAVFYGSAGLTQEAVEAANTGDWRLEKNEHGQQQLYSTRPDMDWLAPSGQLGSFRKNPDDIDFVQGFGDSALVDAQGNYWHDVDHHPVDSSDQPSFTDPGFGKQQGYWASNVSTMLEGQEAALTGVAPEREGVYLKPYYLVQEPETGTYIRITVTEEDLNQAREEGRLDELLDQMAASQRINPEDIASSPNSADSIPGEGDQQ